MEFVVLFFGTSLFTEQGFPFGTPGFDRNCPCCGMELKRNSQGQEEQNFCLMTISIHLKTYPASVMAYEQTGRGPELEFEKLDFVDFLVHWG